MVMALLTLAGAGSAAPTPPVPVPAPVMTPAEAPKLLFTAPSGTHIKLRETVQVRSEVEDIEVSGLFAETFSPADLRRLRAEHTQAEWTEQPGDETVMTVGQVFPDGSRELVTQVSTALGEEQVNIYFTERIYPDGRSTDLQVQSDNPQFQDLLETMLATSEEGAAAEADSSNLHTFPLIPGHSVTETYSVDLGNLFAPDLLNAAVPLVAQQQGLSTEQVAEMMSQVQEVDSAPVTVTRTTTYRGKDAAGHHVFEVLTQSPPTSWTFRGKLPDSEVGYSFSLTVTDLVTEPSVLTYRPDGVQIGERSSSDSRVQLVFSAEGSAKGEMDGHLSITMRHQRVTTLRAE
ncbi:hypothetical protein GCM10017783_05170 [Deinococcus piscis]|uniref:Uncharacterized protein n=2 Tax=Deinococcus piscis TaxID=394230 RepID=A0ABQ3JYV2_9DEIO|nr:hypothetical protein GCM10017783_05170 [Deinococcus piscis]